MKDRMFMEQFKELITEALENERRREEKAGRKPVPPPSETPEG
jgi:hypothetical protein